MKLLLVFAFACAMLAQEHPTTPGAKPAIPPAPPAVKDAPAKPKPPSKSESLKYNVNWPSGLSLGEAILTAAPTDNILNFAFQMDASIPGFSLSESVDSRATPEYCSVLLYKRGTRGTRKIDERTEFNGAKLTAVRTTERGGRTEVSTPACAKDGLAFIYFLRRELAAGRLPPQQKVYYGGAYAVTLKFVGTERIVIGEQASEAEKITATIKGPVTEATADLFFAKDSIRTPLLIRIPLKAGQFSLELIR